MHRFARFWLALIPGWLACCWLVAQEPQASFLNTSQPDRDYVGDPLSPQAIMRFGTLRFLHPSTVTQMVLSPDERTVLTLDNSALIAWDTATGEELWRVSGSSFLGHIIGTAYGQRFICFASDSSRVYTTSNSNQIYVWDTRAGTHETVQLETNFLAGLFTRSVNTIHKSIDVDQAATRFLLGSDTGVKLFDARGKPLWSVTNAPSEPLEIGGGNRDRLTFGGHYSTGMFSPDEQLVACVLSQAPKQITMLDAETGKELSSIALSDKLVRMAFSPDGSSIVGTERDCATRCYSIETGKLLWEHVLAPDPNNAESYTSAVDCSADGKLVAVAASIGPNNLIYLLNAATGKQVGVLSGHTWKPWSVQFTNDSQNLLSTGWDAAVRRWDVTRFKQLPLPQGIRGSDVVTYSRDGTQIAFADGDGLVHVLDRASGSELRRIVPVDQNCSVLTFAPDGKTLFVAGQSRASDEAEDNLQEDVGIQAWNLSTGEQTHHWQWPRGKDPHSDFEALSISPDLRFAAAAVFRQNQAYIWDIKADKQIAVLDHRNVYGLDISRDSKAVATVGWDRMLRLWNIETGEVLCDVSVADALQDQGPDGDLRMYGVKFSPDAKHLAAAHMDGTLSVWDVTDSKRPKVDNVFKMESRFIYGALDYSPDGLWLALGAADGTVKLYDAHLGIPVWTVGKHPEHVYTIAFGGDSRTLVSGGGGISYAWNLVPQGEAMDRSTPPPAASDVPEIDLAATWKSLGSQEPEIAYRAIWALADNPRAAEYLVDRIMQVETVLDPQAITRGQSEIAAQRRLELATKASQNDDKVEFIQVVHRGLMALRMSQTPDVSRLAERIYSRHPSNTVRDLVVRVFGSHQEQR